jgi:hypothetical protein
MFISAAASRKTHTARQLWEEFYYFFVNWSCRFRENLFAFAAIWALNLASPSVAFGVTGAPGQRAHVHRLFLLLLLRVVRRCARSVLFASSSSRLSTRLSCAAPSFLRRRFKTLKKRDVAQRHTIGAAVWTQQDKMSGKQPAAQEATQQNAKTLNKDYLSPEQR